MGGWTWTMDCWRPRVICGRHAATPWPWPRRAHMAPSTLRLFASNASVPCTHRLHFILRMGATRGSGAAHGSMYIGGGTRFMDLSLLIATSTICCRGGTAPAYVRRGGAGSHDARWACTCTHAGARRASTLPGAVSSCKHFCGSWQGSCMHGAVAGDNSVKVSSRSAGWQVAI